MNKDKLMRLCDETELKHNTAEIGTNGKGEVIVNFGPGAINRKGEWHVVFSFKQARQFALTLHEAANDALNELSEQAGKAIAELEQLQSHGLDVSLSIQCWVEELQRLKKQE